jgi:hypothetical protein
MPDNQLCIWLLFGWANSPNLNKNRIIPDCAASTRTKTCQRVWQPQHTNEQWRIKHENLTNDKFQYRPAGRYR